MNLNHVLSSIYYKFMKIFLLATQGNNRYNYDLYLSAKLNPGIDFTMVKSLYDDDLNVNYDVVLREFELPSTIPQIFLPQFIAEVLRGFLKIEKLMPANYLTLAIGTAYVRNLFEFFGDKESIKVFNDLVTDFFTFDQPLQAKFPSERKIAKIIIEALCDDENDWNVYQNIDFNRSYPKYLLKEIYDVLSHLQQSIPLKRTEYYHAYLKLQKLTTKGYKNNANLPGSMPNKPNRLKSNSKSNYCNELKKKYSKLDLKKEIECIRNHLNNSKTGSVSPGDFQPYSENGIAEKRKLLEESINSSINFTANTENLETNISKKGYEIVLHRIVYLKTGNLNIFRNYDKKEKTIIILLDTSGSVSSNLKIGDTHLKMDQNMTQLDCMAAFSSSLIDHFSEVRIFQYNNHYEEIIDIDKLLKVKPSGGTSLGPVLNHIKSEIISIESSKDFHVILISDGFISDIDNAKNELNDLSIYPNVSLTFFNFGNQNPKWLPEQYENYKIKNFSDFIENLREISILS